MRAVSKLTAAGSALSYSTYLGGTGEDYASGLALGARADTSLVRHGADGARVEALFDRLPEALIAVREVSAAGRSTARLDDETVTAARLAEEVAALVEIHGQHDQQRLAVERHEDRVGRQFRARQRFEPERRRAAQRGLSRSWTIAGQRSARRTRSTAVSLRRRRSSRRSRHRSTTRSRGRPGHR